MSTKFERSRDAQEQDHIGIYWPEEEKGTMVIMEEKHQPEHQESETEILELICTSAMFSSEIRNQLWNKENNNWFKMQNQTKLCFKIHWGQKISKISEVTCTFQHNNEPHTFWWVKRFLPESLMSEPDKAVWKSFVLRNMFHKVVEVWPNISEEWCRYLVERGVWL